ncbi:hypothetical protein AXG93_1976s1590 [Marchantia polymorpha subsp. ruderalis]|uniref:Uncharacterized protein n=1 Tax=Marchantia polymorpha subsp. ruderalis TaxID=1480154 RepID=A0A176VEZ5_MARPO|nr:hypothetical protein AXG93_1976s1590 [Marchantia polymorpha subsp. ruderalis]
MLSRNRKPEGSSVEAIDLWRIASLSLRLNPREDGLFALELELDERDNSARVGQRWFIEATRLLRKSRDLANLGLKESLGTLHRSLSNPGRYVKDVEVDTDEEETPASTPSAQPRARGESFAARVPRKRRWKGDAEKSQHHDSAALKRKRPLQELCSRPKQKARMLVLPASSAETGRAAGEKETPSSEEDGNTRTAVGSADLPTPKARTPSAEATRPSGQERRHAEPMNVPTTDRCSAWAPYADSPSGLELRLERLRRNGGRGRSRRKMRLRRKGLRPKELRVESPRGKRLRR